MTILNSQRKKLLDKSQFTSYLKYATGEILLVVIGILIAVSLNNWNEARKQNIELTNIHQLVKQDLSDDIKAIDKILTIFQNTEEYYHAHLNTNFTRESYINKNLEYLILGYPELTLKQRGFDLLVKFNDSANTQGNKLSNEIIDFYTEMLHEVRVDDELRAKSFTGNFEHWKSYPWWADYITQNSFDSFIQYALNDNDYRNRVATSYFINFKVFKPEIEEYKERAQSIIDKMGYKKEAFLESSKANKISNR